jgi:hypothetical protein
MDAMGCNSTKNAAADPQPKQEPEGLTASSQSADKADDVTLTVSFLNGEVCSIRTGLDATLGDVKAKISKKTGHLPWSQKLFLGATPLVDSNKPLKDLGVTGASPLSLVVVEPIGQSSLAAPDGKKEQIIKEAPGGDTNIPFPKEKLTEFEFMSWQAVCAAHKSHSGDLFMEWNENSWPELGPYGVDLHWTTRSDGCRYEYWSSAPGDNEYGVLVRIDNEAMAAIGWGSDDGLEIFEECDTSDVVKELIREGWPRPRAWKEEEEEADEASDDDEP